MKIKLFTPLICILISFKGEASELASEEQAKWFARGVIAANFIDPKSLKAKTIMANLEKGHSVRITILGQEYSVPNDKRCIRNDYLPKPVRHRFINFNIAPHELTYNKKKGCNR